MKKALTKLKPSNLVVSARRRFIEPTNLIRDASIAPATEALISKVGISTDEKSGVQTMKPLRSTTAQKDAAVERLPSEVRRYLLSVLELSELKALVHASPVYHQQYLFDRTYILRRSLLETLGEASVDAYAAHVCDPYTEETAEEGLLILESKHLPLQHLTLPVLERMVKFYRRNVEPLLEPACRPALDMLEKDIEAGLIDIPNRTLLKSPPRGIERLRLIRAIYRYQVFSLISGRPWVERERLEEEIEAQRARVERFIELNHPWELEQLISLYESLIEPFESVCSEVKIELAAARPFEGDPFPHLYGWDHWINSGEAGEGLRSIPLLRSLLVDVLDRKDRLQMIRQHASTENVPFVNMGPLSSDMYQEERRRRHPSRKDQMMVAREPLPFRGDSDLESPPIGWTILWGGTYSNLRGYYNDSYLREWGYVFWAAERFEGTGAKELLERVCDFDSHDARDWLYDELYQDEEDEEF